jgi:hypothetical protein
MLAKRCHFTTGLFIAVSITSGRLEQFADTRMYNDATAVELIEFFFNDYL